MEDIDTYIILAIRLSPPIEQHLGHLYVTIYACPMEGGPTIL